MPEVVRILRFVCPHSFNVVVGGKRAQLVRRSDLWPCTNHVFFIGKKQKPDRGPSSVYSIFVEQLQHRWDCLPRSENIGTVSSDVVLITNPRSEEHTSELQSRE